MSVTEVRPHWFQDLPTSWGVVRLHGIAETRTSNVDKHTVEGQPPVRLCNYTDVYNNDEITPDLTFMEASATPEQIERFRIRVNDTIITKDSETADDIGIPAFVKYEAEDLICGYHLAIVRPAVAKVDPKFLFWALKSEPTMGQWSTLALGVTRVGIRGSDLARVKVPLPPLEDQARIAEYLDDEVSRIDEMVAEQRHLVEMLRVRWDAVVVSAFQGIPKVRLKYLIDPSRPLTYGIVQAGEPVEDGVPYIGPSDIKGPDGVGNPEVLRKTTQEIAAAYQRSSVAPGDVIVSIGPAYGKTMIVPEELRGANLTQDTARVTCNAELVVNRYLQWALRNPSTQAYWDQQIMGATFRRLNLDVLAQTPIPLPSLLEQVEVADSLDWETSKIEELITESERLIELSLKRRSALITAAVTGQIPLEDMRK